MGRGLGTWFRRRVEFPRGSLLVAGVIGGQWYWLDHPAPMGWSVRALRVLMDQAFWDARGRQVRLRDLGRGRPIGVLWFDFQGCPVYHSYLKIMNKYALSPRVYWVAVMYRATPEMAATMARGEGLRFPLWVDPRGTWRYRTPIPRQASSWALLIRDDRVEWTDYWLPMNPVELAAWEGRLAAWAGWPPMEAPVRLLGADEAPLPGRPGGPFP